MSLGPLSARARALAAALPLASALVIAQGCGTGAPGFAATEDAAALDAATTADSGRDAATTDARTSPCSPPATLPDLPTTTSFGLAAPFRQGACASAGVRAFYAACLGSNAGSAACSAWRNANATCANCLLTPRGSTRVGPFHTDPAQPPSDENPASLVDDWSRAIVATCVNGYAPGCGEPALDLDACLTRACAPLGNCAGVTPLAVSECRTRASEASFACRAPYLTREAACPGVFTGREAGSSGGESCFPLTAEDIATPAGAEAYLTRLALAFCGP
jgi:hypothetical protein